MNNINTKSSFYRWSGALVVALMLCAISFAFGACGGGGGAPPAQTNWCKPGYNGPGAGAGTEPSAGCAAVCSQGAVGSCTACCANAHGAGTVGDTRCRSTCP